MRTGYQTKSILCMPIQSPDGEVNICDLYLHTVQCWCHIECCALAYIYMYIYFFIINFLRLC